MLDITNDRSCSLETVVLVIDSSRRNGPLPLPQQHVIFSKSNSICLLRSAPHTATILPTCLHDTPSVQTGSVAQGDLEAARIAAQDS